MKYQERNKLVNDIKDQLAQMAPHQKERKTATLLKEAVDCIEWLEQAHDALCDELRDFL